MVTYRGSRKHVLDWVAQPSFTTELVELLSPVPVQISADSKYMPLGVERPLEARLETFGPAWMPTLPWPDLRDWWLKHKRGANTPNWDMAVGCTIEGRPGLVLVEAKANWRELGRGGKVPGRKPSDKSKENHDHIGRAIDEACAGWKQIDPRVFICRDSHYQLANRLAFTWKLATLGVPVVLVYLGFIGDEGIRADAGAPFLDDREWQRAFSEYTSGVIPLELFKKRIDLGAAPVWLLSRSRPILEQSVPLTRADTAVG
jgi:hypothetical protein